MRKHIRHPHPVWRAVRLVVGVGLVLLGTVSFLIPILPNWLFIIPGLALLATEFRHARRLIVWLRTRLRLRRWRKRRRLQGGPLAVGVEPSSSEPRPPKRSEP